MLRTGHVTLSYRLATYRLCSWADARHSAGSVLSESAAEPVLLGLFRSGEAARLRRMYDDLSGFGLTHASDQHVLDWFVRALRSRRLTLLQVDGSSASSSATASAEPTPAQRTVAAIATLNSDSGTLQHRGQQYRLALVAHQHRERDRAYYEAVAPREAQRVLTEIEQEPSCAPALRTLLRDAVAILEAGAGRGPDHELVLLRRARAPLQAQGASAPITPSQLRKAKETQWIEIRLLDGDGEPMAHEIYEIKLADGGTRRGTLDENGFAYLAGIAPGSCEVSFPNFMTR